MLVPGDPDFDPAALVWNGAARRAPAVVVRCASTADVAAALRWAQDNGVEVAVRGGGHGVSGTAVVEGGLTIDLGTLSSVVVDPVTRRARCGGGATLAQLDEACQEHGLAVPVGMVSHTGVAGLTLGGGYGWLTRMAGLSIDNLVSAEVVLVDGQVVRASAAEHPDLFWALRGGGGNFGVVTEFEFALLPVGPQVHFAMVFFGLDRAEEALRLGRDLFAGLPRDMGGGMVGLNAPPSPFVPEEAHFAPGIALMVVGFGSAEEHAQALAPLRAAAPAFEVVTPMPYVALQQMLDEGLPWGTHLYGKALWLNEIDDAVVDVIAAGMRGRGSPMSQVGMIALGGVHGDVPDDDTALGGSRAARWSVAVEATAADPQLLDGEREWVRSTWESLLPFASGPGGYVNLVAEQAEDRVRAVYGAKYERLARVKAEYDPGNVLRANVNVKPA